MSKRWLTWTLVWAAVTALAFLTINWILALAVAIFGLTVVVVLVMAGDWDHHPGFDDREMVRARKRKEKYERNAGRRAKDRALFEAGQAKKAPRG